MIDVTKIPTEQMKIIMKSEIDKIDKEDSVEFAVVYQKFPGQEKFVKSVSIEIEKINKEDW